MPRLPLIDPAQATGRVREILDGPLKGKHYAIFRAMANSPVALDAYLGLAGAATRASLTPGEREIIQLAVAQATGCDYCLAAHTAAGARVGLTAEQMLGARRGAIPGDPRLDALARFALALHEKRGHVTDADLASFRGAGFTDAQVVEAVVVFALATYTNVINHVAGTPVDFPPAPAL
ncbi:MAG: carboxymuconolactone decarboxylase family protein [Phycisphaerales bacterium]|nr:carboxymuconolactone decarboxylase family protein [Phycisphaerales bacterium]